MNSGAIPAPHRIEQRVAITGYHPACVHQRAQRVALEKGWALTLSGLTAPPGTPTQEIADVEGYVVYGREPGRSREDAFAEAIDHLHSAVEAFGVFPNTSNLVWHDIAIGVTPTAQEDLDAWIWQDPSVLKGKTEPELLPRRVNAVHGLIASHMHRHLADTARQAGWLKTEPPHTCLD